MALEHCSLAVDTAHNVFSYVQADVADSRDSRHLPRLLAGLQRRLRSYELRLRDLLAEILRNGRPLAGVSLYQILARAAAGRTILSPSLQPKAA